MQSLHSARSYGQFVAALPTPKGWAYTASLYTVVGEVCRSARNNSPYRTAYITYMQTLMLRYAGSVSAFFTSACFPGTFTFNWRPPLDMIRLLLASCAGKKQPLNPNGATTSHTHWFPGVTFVSGQYTEFTCRSANEPTYVARATGKTLIHQT